MSRMHTTPNFDGGRALILHRPHQVVDALVRQLGQIGMSATQCWPELGDLAAIGACSALFYDADMGHDEQFPWPAGAAPMPAIALIGSEAPGRLSWAIRQGADAHLLKPVGSGGVFAALVIAVEAFARRSSMSAENAALRVRLGQRQVLAEATAWLMVQANLDAEAAYDRLRRMAMDRRVGIEAAAIELVAELRAGHVRDRA